MVPMLLRRPHFHHLFGSTCASPATSWHAQSHRVLPFSCPETTQVHKLLQLLKSLMISLIISINNEEITDTAKKKPLKLLVFL